jgi:multiple sugar transport system permease protein
MNEVHLTHRMTKRNIWSPYLFISPCLLFLSVLILFPLLSSFLLSFTQYNYVYSSGPKWGGIANYLKLLNDQDFVAALRNTAVYGILFFPSLMLLSLGAALILHQRLKGIGFFRISIFLPVILALSLSGVMFQWIFDPRFGLLNHLLAKLLRTHVALAWLSDERTVLLSLVVVSVWKFTGINMVLFLAGLETIPEALYDAARVDGAGALQRLLFVTLPNLKESFIMAGIWGIIQSIKIFELPFVMTGGGPGNSSLVLYHYMWRTAFRFFDMGYASAIGFVIGGLVLLFSILSFLLVKTERQ